MDDARAGEKRPLTPDEVLHKSHSLRELLELASRLGARMERRRIDGRDYLQLQLLIDEDDPDKFG
jgi:hypothetical protein